MAVDATGPATSPDSIPTYATSADAPSGKGFNAAMAAIQTALNNRASKPAGIVSGEVPVWNGSTWVRSSTLASVVNPAPGFGGSYTYAVANADLSPAPTSWVHYLNATAGSTTVRSITPGVAGQRLVLRNSNSPTTLLHLAGGGISGGQLYLRTTSTTTLQTGDIIEFVYDGSEWLEVGRDKVMPSAKIRAADFPVPNNAVTAVAWTTPTTDWSQGGMIVSSSGITVPETGIYIARLSGLWPANATGGRQFYITGPTTFAFQQIAPSVDPGNNPHQILVGMNTIAAGSVVGAQMFQNSGGSLSISIGAAAVYHGLEVTRIA